ncbi:MMPL family transporter [Paenibacillus sp. GXUN7292]|uniref:MMPL family transporter n=1 Tax=Paenibacillus sp. GXUN7292 TaxID=3422499 RepID=UPI003D7E2660
MGKLTAATAGPRSKWVTVAVWLIVAVVLTIALPNVKEYERNNAPNLKDNAPSVEASKLIAEQFPGEAGIPALIVWQRDSGLTEADYTVIQKLAGELAAQPLTALHDGIPLHMMPVQALQQMTSEDGTVFIQPLLFEEDTQTETLKENLLAIQDKTKQWTESNPFEAGVNENNTLTARISGPAGILVDATDLFKNADFVLLMATVILVLVLLLLIYRSPILAIIPLVGVGFAYVVTSPILGWMASKGWIVVDSQAIAIMTVLLFGAGTDYCLFFITRFRHELLHTEEHKTAIKKTFSGASGAIAMSGFTVVLALLALLAAHYGAYQRFAIPFSLSILIMCIASLTLVPAILAIIGRKAFVPFIPRTEQMERKHEAKTGKKHKKKDPEKQFGNRIGKLVITKPWTVVIVSTLLLGVLAIFSYGIPYKYDLLSSFPDDMPSREGFSQIAEAFEPGELAPLTLVIGDNNVADREKLRSDVAQAIEKFPQTGSVSEPQESKASADYAAYTIVLHTNPYELEAMEAVPQLRKTVEEVLLAHGVENAADQIWIGGQTAEQYDNMKTNQRDSSIIMPLVILLIMILLFVYLRSVWATLYLIATVLLSFLAALGLGWIILHYGLGVEAIQGAIPLYAFVFLIALGEDYNIFMVSSIWKKSREMPLSQAIKEGVSQTGSVITSAGLILAATFAVLASLPLQVLMQFGLITAIGVLLDTFIVRPFLVPAITKLVGERVFWPAKKARVRGH